MKIEYFPSNKALLAEKVSETPEPQRVDIVLSAAELQDAQRWGSFHVASIDITNEKGEIARYQIEIQVDQYNSGKTGCRVTAVIGKKDTKERASKWLRATFIDFKARLKAIG